jgi:hypothetical protein
MGTTTINAKKPTTFIIIFFPLIIHYCNPSVVICICLLSLVIAFYMYKPSLAMASTILTSDSLKQAYIRL